MAGKALPLLFYSPRNFLDKYWFIMYGVTPPPFWPWQEAKKKKKEGKRKMRGVNGTQVWIFPFMNSPAFEGLTSLKFYMVTCVSIYCQYPLMGFLKCLCNLKNSCVCRFKALRQSFQYWSLHPRKVVLRHFLEFSFVLLQSLK